MVKCNISRDQNQYSSANREKPSHATFVILEKNFEFKKKYIY